MNYPDGQLDHLVETACLAADKARSITTYWFRAAMDVGAKEDRTPVTIADQETELAIREIILERHPDHGFFGEETGILDSESEWQWVIDPIDGTKCFATGMPTFGTLISLIHKQEAVIGLIDLPILDERWIGVSGRPTTHNGQPCATRSSKTVSSATVYTTTTDMFNEQNGKVADQFTRSCKFRVFGGDCYGYGLLASGFNDMVCEADLKPYDFFALVPVVTGAGGCITDWQGNTLTLDSFGEVLASANPILHQQAITALNQL